MLHARQGFQFCRDGDHEIFPPGNDSASGKAVSLASILKKIKFDKTDYACL